jgi:tetratricopeptide (TPR) repeat protein
MSPVTGFLLFGIVPIAGFVLSIGGPWMRFLLGGLLLLGGVAYVFQGRRTGHLPPSPPGLMPLTLWACFLILQLVPLPPSILRIVAPETWNVYRESVWLIRPEAFMPISVRPKTTLLEFFALVSGIFLYILMAGLLADRERLRRVTFSLVFFFAALAAAVIASPLLPQGAFRESLLHPHLLGILAMLLAPAIGIYLAVRAKFSQGGGLRRLADGLRYPLINPEIPVVVAVVLYFGAVITHASLAWQIGAAAALLSCAFVLLLRATRRADAIRLLSSVSILAIGGLGFRSQETLAEDTSSYFEALKQFPFLDAQFQNLFVGSGVGTFHESAHLRDLDSVSGVLIMAIEGGVPALAFSAAFVVALLTGIWPHWKRAHERLPLYVAMGALAGIWTFLLASLSEDALLQGPLRLLFFFLAAMAVAAVRLPSRQDWSQPAPTRPMKHPRAALICVTVLFSAYLLFHASIRIAAFQLQSPDPEAGREMRRIQTAIIFDPLEDGYRYLKADLLHKMNLSKAAEQSYFDALRRSPLRREYLHDYGFALISRGEGDLGGRLVISGSRGRSADSGRHRVYVEWLFSSGRTAQAKEAVQTILSERPEETSGYLSLLSELGINEPELGQWIPLQSAAQLSLGKFLLDEGDDRRADEAYRTAVYLLAQEASPDAALARYVLHHFDRSGNREGALEVLRIALNLFPDEIELRKEAVRIYDEAGLTVRSAAERRTLQMLQAAGDRRGRMR